MATFSFKDTTVKGRRYVALLAGLTLSFSTLNVGVALAESMGGIPVSDQATESDDLVVTDEIAPTDYVSEGEVEGSWKESAITLEIDEALDVNGESDDNVPNLDAMEVEPDSALAAAETAIAYAATFSGGSVSVEDNGGYWAAGNWPHSGTRLTLKVTPPSPDPTRYEYQWFRSGTKDPNATGPTYGGYIIGPNDHGHTLTAEITAIKDGYPNKTYSITCPWAAPCRETVAGQATGTFSGG